jgi:predicted nuclease with TOPRIM domain
MKEVTLSRIVNLYKESGYSKEAIACLEYLESCTEHLGNLLEDYRHLQPDNKLFSESILGLVKELHFLKECIYKQEETIYQLKRQVDRLFEVISREHLLKEKSSSEDF